MNAASVVDRVLQDAQRVAGQGNRSLALELIALALEAMPNDPTVLLRAQQIRNLLPVPVAIAATAGVGEHLDAAIDVIEPAPELAAVDGRDLQPIAPDAQQSSLATREELQHALRSIEEAELEAQRLRDLQEEQRALVRSERRRRSTARVLWVALAFGIGALVVAAVAPATLARAPEALRDALDPRRRGERALAEGRLADAKRYAERVGTRAVVDGPARLFLARVDLADRRPADARLEVLAAVVGDSTWNVALAGGRLLLAAGDTNKAADVYRIAFDRGAPSSDWREVVRAQVLAHRTDQAENLLGLLHRSDPSAAALTLDSLRKAP